METTNEVGLKSCEDVLASKNNEDVKVSNHDLNMRVEIEESNFFQMVLSILNLNDELFFKDVECDEGDKQKFSVLYGPGECGIHVNKHEEEKKSFQVNVKGQHSEYKLFRKKLIEGIPIYRGYPLVTYFQVRGNDDDENRDCAYTSTRGFALSDQNPGESYTYISSLNNHVAPFEQNKHGAKLIFELVYRSFASCTKFEYVCPLPKAPIGTPRGGGLLVVIIHQAFPLKKKHHNNPYAALLFRGELRKTMVCI
ncbi:hypothetical protein Tco_1047468 [Tanacetum coccineum]